MIRCARCERNLPEERFRRTGWAPERRLRFCKDCMRAKRVRPQVTHGVHSRTALGIAKQILKDVEWSGYCTVTRERACPWCFYPMSLGHRPTCVLHDFLRRPVRSFASVPIRPVRRGLQARHVVMKRAQAQAAEAEDGSHGDAQN